MHFDLHKALETQRASGNFSGELPLLIVKEAPNSMWISALSAIGAWLAALFLLGFLGIAFHRLFEEPNLLLLLGVFLTAGSAFLLQRTQGFSHHFLLAIHVAGQILFFAYFLMGRSDTTFLYLIGAAYECALMWRIRSFMLRVALALCALFMFSSFYAAQTAQSPYFDFSNIFLNSLFLNAFYWAIAAFLWCFETRIRTHKYAAIILAFAAALTLYSAFNAITISFMGEHAWFFVGDDAPRSFLHPFSLGNQIFCAITLVSCAFIAYPYLKTPRQMSAFVLFLIALLLTWNAPALGLGAFLAAVGFLRGYKILSVLGMLVFVYGISRFYYDLQITLLEKSGLMIAGGLLLLVIRLLLAENKKEVVL